jgi:SAM-dependent methyltransferase
MLKCPYKNGMLNFHKVNIKPSPIETYLTDKKYDLIIMINVLEHCYDVDVIWNKILSMLNPNGIFIFADKFLSVQNIEEFVSSMRDSGHPLRITDDYINKKISSTFNTVFYSTFIEDDLINEYFILKKK